MSLGGLVGFVDFEARGVRQHAAGNPMFQIPVEDHRRPLRIFFGLPAEGQVNHSELRDAVVF